MIRPVKGLEPYLYECLAATFRQDYPLNRLTIHLCISTRKDPAFPTLEKLLVQFPHADARILVEEEDPLLRDNDGDPYPLGPNPKIRNMSRGYREAKSDIIWIVDCNVWVGRGVCGRMVDKLCGFRHGRLGRGPEYKFVHHLPLAVAVDGEGEGLWTRELLDEDQKRLFTGADQQQSTSWSSFGTHGGRLEELFLSSSHAKMYTAINTVLIAPCTVGKSNMFRRSHLNYLTSSITSDLRPRNPGIDYFSDNICEDHLIGDLLWKQKVRTEKELGERWGKHALVLGDFAIQPVAGMSVRAYISRRVRWLRVRKFTVLLATLVEPGTECLLCSLYGSFGITTLLSRVLWKDGSSGWPDLNIWSAFFSLWLLSVLIWAAVDWTLYLRLHSAATVEVDEHTPRFARPLPSGRRARRPFLHWLAAWLGREALALPIWTWAFYGGTTVVWRDRSFKVSFDMKVREIETVPVDSQRMTGDLEFSNRKKQE